MTPDKQTKAASEQRFGEVQGIKLIAEKKKEDGIK